MSGAEGDPSLDRVFAFAGECGGQGVGGGYRTEYTILPYILPTSFASNSYSGPGTRAATVDMGSKAYL